MGEFLPRNHGGARCWGLGQTSDERLFLMKKPTLMRIAETFQEANWWGAEES